jgi:hypothetical protein
MEHKTNVNFPTKGISGIVYLALTFVAMALIFAAAQYFLAPSANVVNEAYAKTFEWVNEYGKRLALVAGITFVFAYAVFTHVLDTPLRQLGSKFRKPQNDSHAIVLLGLAAKAVLLIAMIEGQSFDQYLYLVMTQGSVGELMATVVTLGIARFFGIRSMDEFRDKVEEKDNDTFTMLVVGFNVLTFSLALVL